MRHLERPLRLAAAGAAALMAVLMILLQTVLTPGRSAPTPLFVAFTALWIFAFAMLLVSPAFGRWGTLAWSLLAAWGAWRTHAARGWEDVALVGGSLAVAMLCAAALVVARPDDSV